MPSGCLTSKLVVEVKIGQSNINPNKGGYVQLVDLKNGIFTCQRPHRMRTIARICLQHVSTWPLTTTSTYQTGTTSRCTCMQATPLLNLFLTQRTGLHIPGPSCYRTLHEKVLQRATEGTRLHNELEDREGRHNVNAATVRKWHITSISVQDIMDMALSNLKIASITFKIVTLRCNCV